VLFRSFSVGAVVVGRFTDRVGIFPPVVVSILVVATGFAVASMAPNLWWFTLAQGIAIGTGSAATFAPLLADTSLWFVKRRGLAVGIFASGNYLGGVLWPPVVQHFIASAGWRPTYLGIGVFCLLAMLPLSLMLRRRSPAGSGRVGRWRPGAGWPRWRRLGVAAWRCCSMAPRAFPLIRSGWGCPCCAPPPGPIPARTTARSVNGWP
jgi:MFS family permease